MPWELYSVSPLGGQILIKVLSEGLEGSKLYAEEIIDELERIGEWPEGHDAVISDNESKYLYSDNWEQIL